MTSTADHVLKQSVSDLETDLQGYLHEHKIEPLLKDVVVKLCVAQPDDPLKFIIDHFTKLHKMQHEGEDDKENEDDFSDDEEEHRPVARGRTRRAAISASVMTADDVEGYERKVVPKDAATMVKLQKAVSENILFQHLEDDELTEVLDAMFLVKKTTGDTVIEQGDDGDNFYVVDSGNLEVWKAEPGEESKKVLDLTSGMSFGELALIYNQPRAASVKAVSDVTLWAIDQETYKRILMGSTIKKRKEYEEFLAKVEILSSIDKYERLQVADALDSCTFEDGTNIVTQGEEGTEFFIIVTGNADVTQTNEAGESGKVGELSSGQYFGEIALLKDNKRHATVTAKGTVKCVKLDRDTFERVLGPIETLLRRNMDLYETFASKE
eukprot:m.44290 g.44290  ORF g.44290 m.44290 type:complete len:381 (+) comp10594_c0_seq6:204-1346(+)